MFSVNNSECTGFDSQWRVTKVSLENTTQTNYVSHETAVSTIPENNTCETQTDFVLLKSADYDEAKLANWLKSIYPTVKKELDDGATTQAFKNYRPTLQDIDINAIMFKKINTNNESLPISAMTWNSTGYTIAISSKKEHKKWCHHNSFVNFYTFDRNDSFPDQPQTTISTENCITCLKFHPVLPSVIAVGTFSGEILIYNIQNVDADIIAKVHGHDEALTQISWINDIDSIKSILLATSSLDGFLNLWNFNSTASSLHIKLKYCIKAPLFGKTRRKNESNILSKKVDRGIIAFDFSKFMPEIFVVAAEGGLITQCSMLGPRQLQSPEEYPILDPVYTYYQCHEGEASGIYFSPNRQEMFLTNGSDGEIRVYIIGQEEPAKIIFPKSPLQCVSWVPHQESLFAGCGIGGILEIFNVQKGQALKDIFKENPESSPITQMEINHKRITVVCLGSKTGQLEFWKVPWNVYSRKM